MIEIRKEEPRDQESIHRLNVAAFADDAEATIIDNLRVSCDNFLSFVALADATVVGHILFTPVTVAGGGVGAMGLAPMAVLPSYQRKGIGSQLVHYGLQYLRQSGCPFVIVLGHPEYYPRFGFELASSYGLLSQWEGVPDEAFMIVVFDSSSLPKATSSFFPGHSSKVSNALFF